MYSKDGRGQTLMSVGSGPGERLFVHSFAVNDATRKPASHMSLSAHMLIKWTAFYGTSLLVSGYAACHNVVLMICV